MENTSMAISTDAVVAMNDPVTPQVPEISLDPMDFQKEINKIAAEQGMEIKDGNAVPSEQPQAATQPQVPDRPTEAVAQPEVKPEVKIPEKFQTNDGKADLDRIAKSTVNAEEAISRYLAKEAELRKIANQVNGLERQVNSQPPTINPALAPINAQAINERLKQTGDPGQVMLELANLTYQAAHQQALIDAQERMAGIEAKAEARQRTDELRQIATDDPWVFTNEGIQKLAEIRQAKPYLNAASEPWKAAYDAHLAEQYKSQRSKPQVLTPTPTPQAARLPATPVSGGARTPVSGPNLQAIMSDERALNTYLNGLSPAQQTAFWKSVLPGAK